MPRCDYACGTAFVFWLTALMFWLVAPAAFRPA